MRNSPGKQLDEVCNNNNEDYSEEVLYASWAEVPPAAPRPVIERGDKSDALKPQDVEGILTRLYTYQG